MDAIRDQNFIAVALGVSSANASVTLPLTIDSATGRVLADVAGGNPGTVTSVSVVSANGFAGSVANATSTPAITLTTTVTGILSGNGTAISAASTTGSGSVVLATSPTLVTPTLGVATATSINGLTITSSTGTFSLTNGKTLTVLKTMSFTAADDTGVYTLPTGTKTLVATDVTTLSSLVSVGTISTGTWSATTIAVNRGGTGQTSYTDGQLLIGNSSGNTLTKATLTAGTGISVTNGSGSITIATTGGGVPTVKQSTVFETSARFGFASTNGTRTFNAHGVDLTTTGTSGSYGRLQWEVSDTTSMNIFNAGGSFTCAFALTTSPTDGSAFLGLGDVTVSGAGHTFTVAHIGFKVLTSGSTNTLYATVADGTETATSLGTFASNDAIEVIAMIVSSVSVNFYWRKNGGTLSSATNITTHIPTSAERMINFSASNNGVATANTYNFTAASFER